MTRDAMITRDRQMPRVKGAIDGKKGGGGKIGRGKGDPEHDEEISTATVTNN